jgi:hypothetical protein
MSLPVNRTIFTAIQLLVLLVTVATASAQDSGKELGEYKWQVEASW